MREILPTVVPAQVDDIASAVTRYFFAQTLHIDITDGTLTPNTTWLFSGEYDIPRKPLSYEAHLMVANPLSLGIMCANGGVSRIIAHIESFPSAERAREAFAAWRAAGAREVGIAVTMKTSINACDAFVPLVDVVQFMTIDTIGSQGAPFSEHALARVASFHARHPTKMISVDGGVNSENIGQLARAGAMRFCVGSALARAENPASTYKMLLEAANAVS